MVDILKQNGVYLLLGGPPQYRSKFIEAILANYFINNVEISYLPQNVLLYNNFKIIEFFKYICKYRNVKKLDIINELIIFGRLEFYKNDKIKNLSNDIYNKVCLLQALINNSEFLFLDGFDDYYKPVIPNTSSFYFRYIKRIKEMAKNKSILIQSSNFELMDDGVDFLIILKNNSYSLYDVVELKLKLNEYVWEIRGPEDLILETSFPILFRERLRDEYRYRTMCKTKPDNCFNPIKADITLNDIYYYFMKNINITFMG